MLARSAWFAASLAVALLAWALNAFTPSTAANPLFAAEAVAKPDVSQWHLLTPAWDSLVVHGESSILLQETEGGPLVGRLAFPVDEVLSVQTSNRTAKLSAAEGLKVDLATGRFELPASSSAPRIRAADLFPPTGAPMSYKHRVGKPEQSLLYGPGRWFHDHQVEVTYRRRNEAWTGYRPVFAEQLLPKTIARLRAGERVVVGVSGDSISAGGDASGLNGAEPNQPPFADLVAAQLRASYPSEVVLKNRAVGGWSIANGNQDLDNLLAEKPDLIIMAYGMNDVGRRDPAWFKDQAQTFIAAVRKKAPGTELILVTPMLGTIEWVHTPREMFFKYRDELKPFVGPGIALADVTELWSELLRKKHDLDYTGNGLNHPNDYGHRLYAQAILSLLVAR